MSIQPLTGSGLPTPPLTNSGTGAVSSGTPFADLVKGLIQDTSSQQTAADQEVQKLISGETESIHDIVLTTAKANMAFQLVMEIRNRLISSYQEIMRMQM
ncbi:MAG: flagellar hook-basal body complex protein FliE [Planctomycetaceae bacterium]|nr:flagellar hook-basal body complex protein FliE [Planctomycetaceae bacterium]